MGMFDHYQPKPDISCPICGAAKLEWQGKDGPSALFVWEQGRPTPVDQRVDGDCKGLPEATMKARLPIRFEISAECRCPTPLMAVGTASDGVWTQTELLNPRNAIPYATESEREFRKRLATLAKHPGHAG
jgi:hypothetical protein